MTSRFALLSTALLAFTIATEPMMAQKKTAKPVAAPTTTAPQPVDEEYTKLIKQYLQDPRITTELVDHMPASATVP